MNKAERLNRLQRYAYRKRRFTLGELMDEFGISRSTALRDIVSLEEIGIPLYADRGRNGGYRVLETASLPPVSFTTGEVLAMYFAMQSLRGVSGDAFRVSFDSIHAKFLDVVSEQQREQIERFRHRIAFYSDESVEAGEHLEDLLQAAVQGKVLKITYAARRQTWEPGGEMIGGPIGGSGVGMIGEAIGEPGREPSGEAIGELSRELSGEPGDHLPKSRAFPPSVRRIQPFAVYAARGFWYCRAYDLDKQDYRVFRCDRVLSAEVAADEPIEELSAFDLRSAHTLRKPSAEAIPFRCLVAPEAAARLRRRLYPSMALSEAAERDDRLLFSGCYEPRETDFIVSYLASFGSAIKILEPEHLREELRAHYLKLIEAL
ncbi:helix-turn-helix transcriptional regulator [Saccharibacillus kuerlensis]|uniref:Transcriptional regulator n=1 Tax=Saccharibacillus kuerlensis TaxID=459527 RepID=A0ABQ2L506_9BACL|nr:YafY family protein [Saccharibacillus kuerlensis]GGO03468.1 hypothetical protein GCM10010969_27770 [Saccharibacillus kuerlensis]